MCIWYNGEKTSWIPFFHTSCWVLWSQAFRVCMCHKKCCSSVHPSQQQSHSYQDCGFTGVNPSRWAVVTHVIRHVFNSRGSRSFFFSSISIFLPVATRFPFPDLSPHSLLGGQCELFLLLPLLPVLWTHFIAQQMICSKLLIIITAIIARLWPQVPSRNSREGFWFSTPAVWACSSIFKVVAEG